MFSVVLLGSCTKQEPITIFDTKFDTNLVGYWVDEMGIGDNTLLIHEDGTCNIKLVGIGNNVGGTVSTNTGNLTINGNYSNTSAYSFICSYSYTISGDELTLNSLSGLGSTSGGNLSNVVFEKQ